MMTKIMDVSSSSSEDIFSLLKGMKEKISQFDINK